jgi:hypothetical protein
LQALSSYAALLDRSSPSLGAPSRASQTKRPQDRILAAAAGQAAASRSAAATDLLFLLYYMGATRSMGVFTVSGGLWQHMQQSLIPKVTAAQNLRLPVTKMLADFSGLADRIVSLSEVT